MGELTPSVGTDFAAPLDAEGRLAVDVPCIKCGYNLRGLALDYACPECGLAVAESADRQRVIAQFSKLLPALRLSMLLVAFAPWALIAHVILRISLLHLIFVYPAIRPVLSFVFSPLLWFTPAVVLCVARRWGGSARTFEDVPKLAMSLRALDIITAGSMLFLFVGWRFVAGTELLAFLLAAIAWYVALSPSVIVLRLLGHDAHARRIEWLRRFGVGSLLLVASAMVVILATFATPRGAPTRGSEEIAIAAACVAVASLVATSMGATVVLVRAADKLRAQSLD